MNQLYQTIGISKQAIHQYAFRQCVFDYRLQQMVTEAEDLRTVHPGCGVEKMYDTLKPDFIGRDRFVETMMQLGFRLKRKKNYRRTTFSSKVYYPNLIKGMTVTAPSEVWQSDITYIPVNGQHYYAVFIIDVYTKKIIGYQVSDHMRATANIKALQMALKQHKAPKIHHSDRGSQYIYKEYLNILKESGCDISMSKTAQDNAYAERINRTIKEEYLCYWQINNLKELRSSVKKAVKNYNCRRPHNYIGKLSPIKFEEYWSKLEPEQRPIISIFNNEIYV
jgi:putative transposase